jgi:hypothetical protein
MTQIANLKALAAKQEELATSSTVMPIDQRMRHVSLWQRYEEAARDEIDFRPEFDEASWEADKILILPPAKAFAQLMCACWYYAKWVCYSVSLVGGLAVAGYAVWELVR